MKDHLKGEKVLQLVYRKLVVTVLTLFALLVLNILNIDLIRGKYFFLQRVNIIIAEMSYQFAVKNLIKLMRS